MSAPRVTSIDPDRIAYCLLTVAGFSRLLVLAFLPELEFPDTSIYFRDGERLITHGFSARDIYMPLYSLLSYITGGDIGLKLLDIVLSTLTVWLIYRLCIAVFRQPSVALAATLMAAIYPHFLFYSVARLSETLYICLTVASFVALYRGRYGLGSVLLVTSILTRPSADFIAPLLIVVFAAVVHRLSAADTIRKLLIYCVTYVALMSPWWIHNHLKYGEFVRLTLGDGIVLYSGNNPHNRSGGGVANNTAGDDMNLSKFDHIRDPLQKNAAMKQAAYDFIVDNPYRFVELAALKFVRFWRLWPYAPEYQKPHIIVASLLSYGVVLALALSFVARFGRKYWRSISPFLLFIAYLSAIHMITIGSIRYRLPLEPFLIVLAGFHTITFIYPWPPAKLIIDMLNQNTVDRPAGVGPQQQGTIH